MDDLISRQWLVECVNDGSIEFDTQKDENIFIHLVRDIAPSAQPERKTGQWIVWNYPGAECARCSVCREEYDQMDLYIGGNEYPNFCPNCGAKMEEEQNE